ncbi:DNA-directed RNA polymerase subunit alpha [Candidatus Dependentiae bacterium]|nr:DNA-directed RNA polymerase subunit alpha [Candidatus Dependentiae bacterium]
MQEKKYKPIILPNVDWEMKTLTEEFGELVAQPLEPGFGITLGNALRRVMLSAVEGSAVTSVIIKGVNNEFSSIKGVVEDTLHVLLNIKGIVIKNKTGESGKMNLSISGESIAKVADIKADDHLELVNKDHIIAHLSPDANLEIEFFVETDRGYLPAQWPKGDALQSDGRIYVDAMFSPVVNIEYHVEKTRVGQSIDYDKLILKINTNGSVSPSDILRYGTSVLRTQLEHFLDVKEIPFNEISKQQEDNEEKGGLIDTQGPTKGLPVDLFLKPIDELEFSVRAHNCLVSAGIRRVIDLVNLSYEDLLKIKNFGRKSLREVKEVLSAFGLHLGMNVKELDLKKAIKEQEDSLKS